MISSCLYSDSISCNLIPYDPLTIPRLLPQVGYVAAAIRAVADARVGDTITHAPGNRRVNEDGSSLVPASEMFPGYREAVPMVFCGLFPIDADQFPSLREALEKLQLNDAALAFEPESSSAMGFGFRCGFLGLLHMDVVQVRAGGRQAYLNMMKYVVRNTTAERSSAHI